MFYAYTDEDRSAGNEVLAEGVNDNNKLEQYFCPTTDCAARMSIRNIHGEGAAYFAANPSTPHSGFCRINLCTRTQYDEGRFDFDNFMGGLFQPGNQNNGYGNGGHGNGNGQIRPVSTVRQLYLICIQRHINQLYNGNRISDLLIDSRTRHIYFRYIQGRHLVECKFWRYEKEKNEIFAKYWLNDEGTSFLKIKLKCENSSILEKISKKVYKKDFVVAGIWEMNGGYCVTDIVSSKQIYVIPDQQER